MNCKYLVFAWKPKIGLSFDQHPKGGWNDLLEECDDIAIAFDAIVSFQEGRKTRYIFQIVDVEGSPVMITQGPVEHMVRFLKEDYEKYLRGE